MSTQMAPPGTPPVGPVEPIPTPRLRLVAARPRAVARRAPTREHGEALERLAHAIEYLMDRYMDGGYRMLQHAGTAEFEAAQILMRLNRELHASFPAVETVMERLRKALVVSRANARPSL